MKNKIIEVQELLFKEMKKLDNDEVMFGKKGKKELARSTALYNQTTNFIKAINTNLKIMDTARTSGKKVEDMIKYLGLDDE